jgi:ABC-2 type transport system permease protein
MVGLFRPTRQGDAMTLVDSMTLKSRALTRIGALMLKESRQLLRDRATLGMLLGIPILQIALFGCAIELSPQSLAVTVVAADSYRFERLQRLIQSQGLVVHIQRAASHSTAMAALNRGQTLLVVDTDASPPVGYLDAIDPVLSTQAELLIERLARSVSGPVDEVAPPPFVIKRVYNSGARTQPFIVSGLVGVILTMSLIMMSALTLARERESGTLEGLLTTPVRAVELWVGKLSPYVALGLLQATFVLLIARLAFDIYPVGSLFLLAAATFVFAIANLALGFMFSCLAQQQMQAMQMTFFFFLPSSLLSGFMFPFDAMPRWAQGLGEILPLTHYLRIVRGLLLRGADAAFVVNEMWPIGLFATGAAAASLIIWRRSIA